MKEVMKNTSAPLSHVNSGAQLVGTQSASAGVQHLSPLMTQAPGSKRGGGDFVPNCLVNSWRSGELSCDATLWTENHNFVNISCHLRFKSFNSEFLFMLRKVFPFV